MVSIHDLMFVYIHIYLSCGAFRRCRELLIFDRPVPSGRHSLAALRQIAVAFGIFGMYTNS